MCVFVCVCVCVVRFPFHPSTRVYPIMHRSHSSDLLDQNREIRPTCTIGGYVYGSPQTDEGENSLAVLTEAWPIEAISRLLLVVRDAR